MNENSNQYAMKRGQVSLFNILRKSILFHYINVDIAHVTKYEINEFQANMVEYYQFSISAMKMQMY